MAPLPVVAGDVARSQVEAAINALLPHLRMSDGDSRDSQAEDPPASAFPVLTLRQFQVLAAIADGKAHSRQEILRGGCADIEASHLSRILSNLARGGFLGRRRGGVGKPVGLSITSRGLRSCRAFGAYVATTTASVEWADPLETADVAPEVAMAPMVERLAVGQEECRLLARASPEFALAYRVLHSLPASVVELAALNVDDVDLARHRMRVGNRGFVALEGIAWQLVCQAVGGRQTGPLIQTTRGRRWSPGNLLATFRRLAVATGLPPEVKFATRARARQFRR